MCASACLALVVGLFSVILLIGHLFNKQKRIKQCLRNINGPPPKPLIGNALEIRRNSIDSLKDLIKLHDKYGPLTKLFIGLNKTILLISDPELVELITSSPKYLQKGVDYYNLRPWLLNGLLISTGSYWQKRRKLITPTFHFKILEEFILNFNSQGQILVNKLMKEVDKTIDIYPFITAFTLDSICISAMGTNTKAQDCPDNKYVQAVKTLCSLYIKQKFSVWKNIDFLYKFSSDYKKQKVALDTVHGFTKSVIEKRRKELLTEKPSEEMEDDVGMKKRKAFLDLILQSTVDGQPLSDKDILEEVETFMFAGHDTTAAAISFTLYAVSHNPHIQRKLVEELELVFGDDKQRLPSIQDLRDLKYMDIVIKESLRMYPPVAYVSRKLEVDIIYKGITIPKGIDTMMFIYYMHHSAENFKNPDQFNPERFLTESTNHFAYIPFSAGPRNCIGQKYALYEIKAALCKIIRNFEILPADPKYNLVLSSEVILKPASGLHLILKKRKL